MNVTATSAASRPAFSAMSGKSVLRRMVVPLPRPVRAGGVDRWCAARGWDRRRIQVQAAPPGRTAHSPGSWSSTSRHPSRVACSSSARFVSIVSYGSMS